MMDERLERVARAKLRDPYRPQRRPARYRYHR